MRIESNRPLKAAAARRDEKAAASNGGSSFAELLSTETAAGAAPAAPVGGSLSLLALQEVSDQSTRRRQARARGEALLDGLEELRIGLLSGSMSREKLAGLARTIRSARVSIDDPKLQAVLDDIELRAEVELAKLSVALG